MRLIDADALKEQFNGVPDSEDKDIALMIIDNAPTVPLPDFKEGYKQAIIDGKTNYSRPQGEWIEDYTAKEKRVVACNKCYCLNIMGKSNFCPNCGADMRKGGAE